MKPIVWPWQQSPFLRYFPALAAGIALQEKWAPSPVLLAGALVIVAAVLGLYPLLPLRGRYRLALLHGLLVHLLPLLLGALLLWRVDVRHRPLWIGNSVQPAAVALRLEEEPVARARSLRAIATVEAQYAGGHWKRAEGRVLLYFPPATPGLEAGSRIATAVPLGEVTDSRNPGGFNYRQYCLYQGITHQAYLPAGVFTTWGQRAGSPAERLLLSARRRVLSILRASITGRKEQGLAEALLIGYRTDLDQDLVQAYTRTGVVHIIAISGMHLALIYGLLAGLTHPLRKGRWRWLRLALILAGLWGFSALAGAQASVVRSTVMFSCVALGHSLSRRIPIYNSLALSAFLLLCYNPYWLWDVGFQLSYTAVLSLVLFYPRIYRLCAWHNRLLDTVWQNMAVCLAAQVLTTPLSIYHFHQFPLLFLLTNLVAVPLSTLVLMGEILVCALSWTGPPALFIGRLTGYCLHAMNAYIERLDRVSFAVWDGLSISLLQMCLLLLLVAALSHWRMRPRERSPTPALLLLLAFVSLRSLDLFRRSRQRELIVYSAPRQSMMQLIDGRLSWLMTNEPPTPATDKLYLQPAATLMRIRQTVFLSSRAGSYCFSNHSLLLVRGKSPPVIAMNVDVLVVAGRPSPVPGDWLPVVGRIVLDPTVPRWIAEQWKTYAIGHRIDLHDVAEKGAFVMSL